MDVLALVGLLAVVMQIVCYALQDRAIWYTLGFSGACALGAIYCFIEGALPFATLEAIWAGVALRRWWTLEKAAMSQLIHS